MAQVRLSYRHRHRCPLTQIINYTWHYHRGMQINNIVGRIKVPNPSPAYKYGRGIQLHLIVVYTKAPKQPEN
jgi:hypothetical protein